MRDRLSRHFVACAAVAAAVTAQESGAAIVRVTCNLAVPANNDGVYIDIASQSFAVTAFTGWDLNISGPNRLAIYGNPSAPELDKFVRTQGSGPPSNLALGSVIGSSSTFVAGNIVINSSNQGLNDWALNATNYFGFKFYNNTTSAVNYGYGAIQVGATATVRTLLYLDYGDAGEAVTIPVPIPAPGVVALLGIAGLAGRRRVRRSPGPRPGAASGTPAPSAHG